VKHEISEIKLKRKYRRVRPLGV